MSKWLDETKRSMKTNKWFLCERIEIEAAISKFYSNLKHNLNRKFFHLFFWVFLWRELPMTHNNNIVKYRSQATLIWNVPERDWNQQSWLKTLIISLKLNKQDLKVEDTIDGANSLLLNFLFQFPNIIQGWPEYHLWSPLCKSIFSHNIQFLYIFLYSTMMIWTSIEQVNYIESYIYYRFLNVHIFQFQK